MTDESPTGSGLVIGGLPDRCDLRLPSEADTGLDALVASANRVAHDRAAARLDAELGGIDFSAIARDPGPTQPAMTDAVVHSHPVTGADLLDAIDPGRLHGVTVNDPTGNRGVAPAPSTAAGVAAALDRGAIVRIDRVTALLPHLAALADDIASVLAARVGLSALVATGSAGPVRNWNDHDLLVVPLAGTIGTALVGPADEAPVPGITVDPAGSPTFSTDLSAGSALLVPRGWGLHLEIVGGAAWAEVSIRRMRGTDVASFVAGRAGAAPAFRENAPWDPTAVEPDPASVFGDPDGLRRRFDELDVEGLSQIAVAAWSASLTAVAQPTVGRLLGSSVSETPVRVVAPGGIVAVDRLAHDAEPAPPGSVSVAIAGSLVHGTPDTIASIAAGHPLGAARRVLIAAGLARPDPGWRRGRGSPRMPVTAG